MRECFHGVSVRSGGAENGQVPDISTVFADALRASLPGLDAPPASLAKLLATRRRKRLTAGQVLFGQGQRMQHGFVLGRGRLRLEMGNARGQRSALDALPAPAFFGLAALLTQRPSRYEAQALEASEVWPIDRTCHAALMQGWPSYTDALMLRLAEGFDGNLGLLASARHAPLGERVREALQRLPGLHEGSGWQRAAITQTELARLAGLSRQGVNQWLREAQREGRAELGYGWLRWRA
jgi:CRP/FNR family transcriptional regulator, cyclic AMP receptor protein